MKNAKNNRNRKSGFTLAELLVVVAIIMILAGVSFVAVIRYQKSLRRLEMDQTAKEIFLAAQNRLSLEKSNGTMERLLNGSFDSDEIKNKLGTKVEEAHRGAGTGEEDSASSEAGTESGSVGTGTGGDTDVTADATDLYCIRYTAKNSTTNENEDIRERLLPFGSIDDTVRIGGNYLIFYEPKNGSVRAVWYSDTYEFAESDYKGNALNDAAVSASKRESFTGTNSDFANHGCPVGYYGGARTEDDNRTDDTKLDSISLELKNEEVLYAVVTDPNIIYPNRKYEVKLWIEGVDSRAKACVDLTSSAVSSAARYCKDIANQKYYWILDDITAKGTRFADLKTDLNLKWSDENRMIPGENVGVYAEIYAKGQTKPYQTTTVYQENSLFQDKKANGVTIANARHLENLDYRVSQFNPSASELGIQAVNDENNTGDKCYVAEQLKDVSWTEFCKNVATVHCFGNGFTGLEGTKAGVTPYYYRQNGSQAEGGETTQGCFLPVEPQFALYYKGNAFFVENLEIHPNQDTETAGLFGTVKNNLTVENLKLFYPVVTSKVSTGGLIGLGEDNSKILVKDVIVQYPKVTAEGGSIYQTTLPPLDAGGIIGDFRGTQLTLDGCLVENQTLVQVSGNAKAQNTKTLPEGVNPDTLEVRAESSSAGGLLGSMTEGNLTVHSCAASVYVNAETYAGGLLGSVTTSGTVNIDSSYVGGHTNDGKMLSSPLPSDTNFAGTTGRYNIVSRNGAAGGLAAIVPTDTTIAHSYVTASVYANPTQSNTTDSGAQEWENESNADDSQQYAAFVRFKGNMSTANPGIKASDCSYCYSIALVNGARAQVYSADLNMEFQAIMNGQANTGLFAFLSEKKAFPYDNILGETYPMLTVQELVKKDQEVTADAKKTLSRYATVHIGDWMVPVKAKDSNFQVINGNRLTVRIETGSADQNASLDYAIKVHGVSSDKYVYFRIKADGSNSVKIYRSYPASSWTTEYTQYTSPALTNLYNNETPGQIDFYLDNISQKDCRFGSIVPCSNDAFWPGEDITINVSSLNNDIEWSNISSMTFDENNAVLTNSCFGSIEKNPTNTDLVTEHNEQKIEKINKALSTEAVTTGKDRGLITIGNNYYVQIDNSRHLQNLSSYISGGFENEFYTKLAGAIQTDDIYWSGKSTSCTKSFTEEFGENVKVYGALIQNGWNAGKFYPIYLNDNRNNLEFKYVGSGCRISGLSIKGDSAAGLFGEVGSPFSAKDLTFENISAEGTNTGALAGNFSGSQIKIQNLKLSTNGDNVQNTIKGNGCTGGFVGYATGEAEIKNSCINGETEVTSIGSDWSAAAGGVIGYISQNVNLDTVTLNTEVTVTADYSNAKAGGFIGNVGNGSSEVKILNSGINGSTTITATNGYAAGTMAYIDYNVNAKVDNLRMEGNLNVIGKNATGGLVGFTQGSMLTISNSGLKTTSVNSTEGRAAGLVADTTSEVEIVGTQIDSRLTVNGKQETGGFVGNTTNKLSIKNSSVLDAAVTSSANKAGGLVGVAATSNDVTLSKVKVIGKNTEIRGYNSTGGLFGRLEAANINIDHAAVSAFICAKGNGSDTNANGGGLIGEIKTTGNSSILQNSYYGGRTKNGKYEIITLPYDGGSTGNTYKSNIYGYQTAGGIIGWVDEVRNLSIQCCFSTGSVENGYKDKDVGLTAGGFIGAASKNDGSLTMQNCYSMGKVEGNPNNQGGFVGYINKNNLSCNSEVYYLDVFNDDTLGIYGLYKNNTVKHNVTLSINKISQSDKIEAGAKAIAHSYDPTLPEQYPYLIWTQESAANVNTIIYYGDWPEINLDGAFVYFYPGSDKNWNNKQEGYVTFYRYDGETLEAYLKKDSSSTLEKIQKEESFGIMINSTTKYEQLVKMYTYKDRESSDYKVINAFEGGNDYSAEYASVSYLGKKYYLYRITTPKGKDVSKLWIQHIKNYNDDDGTYTVDGEYQWNKNNTAWTKLN